MLRITELEKIKGKTIDRAGSATMDRQVFFCFTDDSYIVFSIDLGTEDGDEEIQFNQDLDLTDLLLHKIITQEQYDSRKDIREKDTVIETEKRERLEYERLKAKFD